MHQVQIWEKKCNQYLELKRRIKGKTAINHSAFETKTLGEISSDEEASSECQPLHLPPVTLDGIELFIQSVLDGKGSIEIKYRL